MESYMKLKLRYYSHNSLLKRYKLVKLIRIHLHCKLHKNSIIKRFAFFGSSTGIHFPFLFGPNPVQQPNKILPMHAIFTSLFDYIRFGIYVEDGRFKVIIFAILWICAIFLGSFFFSFSGNAPTRFTVSLLQNQNSIFVIVPILC